MHSVCKPGISLSFQLWYVRSDRVPTGTGKHGIWQKNPCMEKSWNLKNDEISWKNHGILVLQWQFGCLWDSFFSSLASLAQKVLINKVLFFQKGI